MRRPGFLRSRLGNFGQAQTLHAQANAHGKTVSLKCPSGTIEVADALYGENCKGKPCYKAGKQSAVKDHIAGTCNGSTNCDYTIDESVIGDPCPHCVKDYKVTYDCPAYQGITPEEELEILNQYLPPPEIEPSFVRRNAKPVLIGGSVLLLGALGMILFISA